MSSEQFDNESSEFSEFEKSVLHFACLQDPCSAAALEQLRKAAVVKREFTTHGWFIHFETDASGGVIESDDRIMPGSLKVVLKNPVLEHGADAIVWMENGVMDCLEMYVFGAEPWPEQSDGFTIERCD